MKEAFSYKVQQKGSKEKSIFVVICLRPAFDIVH